MYSIAIQARPPSSPQSMTRTTCGILDLRKHSRFAPKASQSVIRTQEMRSHDLDGHIAVQPLLVCQPDDAHSSRGNPAHELIFADPESRAGLDLRVFDQDACECQSFREPLAQLGMLREQSRTRLLVIRTVFFEKAGQNRLDSCPRQGPVRGELSLTRELPG
jgi:hypothetical protein